MKIRAAVFYESNKALAVEEIELDPPKDGEVLVKMVATGVCHSDVHYYTGDAILPSGRPTILGHEGAGIVEAVGEGVAMPEVADLPEKFLSMVIRSVDQDTLVRALVTADDNLTAKILEIVPERMQLMIKSSLEASADITPEESEEAQKKLLTVIRTELKSSGGRPE